MTAREEVELFGGSESLFGCRHLPSAPTGAGVVICASGPFDGAVDQGRVARLGRRLAGAGVAVQRFHYRGTGWSDGDAGALGFRRLVDDAGSALRLIRSAGVDRLGFVGARFGALVAARLAHDLPGAPVAVWEPVVDPRRLLEHAVAAGVVDLLDTPLAAELFEGTLVGSLVDELGGSPRPLLLVQTGPPPSLRADYKTVAERARARGLTVETACHPCDGVLGGLPVPAAPADELIEHTSAWLAAHLVPAPRGVPGAAAVTSTVTAP
ncbi:MAG: hypothetical protein ACRDZN_07945 [Acidimicrobiales bacterium]